jgi:hypothetical protein
MTEVFPARWFWPESEVHDMSCEVCRRLERLFLESIVFADRAETSLRCYLITHQHFAGVSDMDEYQAVRAEQQRTADERHKAYMDFMIHAGNHGESAAHRAV